MTSSPPGIHAVLQQLAKRGWITLRQMSPLLGYSHPTGIYGRQKSKKAISTILIGNTYRVYADVVVQTLEDAPAEDQEASRMMLHVYREALKEQEHE